MSESELEHMPTLPVPQWAEEREREREREREEGRVGRREEGRKRRRGECE